jgi:hypothetical protein
MTRKTAGLLGCAKQQDHRALRRPLMDALLAGDYWSLMASYGLVNASEAKAFIQSCATASPQSVSLKLARVHT